MGPWCAYSDMLNNCVLFAPSIILQLYNINPKKCTFPKLIIQFLIFYVFYMFRNRGFIFRKTVQLSNLLFYLLDCLHSYMHNVLYHTCIYNGLPEDGHSGSKHVEDIKY